MGREDGPQRVNVLTPARLSDMGRGATFFSTTIQVEKLKLEEQPGTVVQES